MTIDKAINYTYIINVFMVKYIKLNLNVRLFENKLYIHRFKQNTCV